ncbi:MAG: LysE family translocator [Ilumatobacteraceae bacterium]
MPEWSTLAAFCATVAGLMVIPGPAVFYMVNRTLADGRSAGFAAVAGLEVGDTVQSVLAALGVSAAVATSETLFNIVKWAGVVYLVWSGTRTMMTTPSAMTTDESHVTHGMIFRQGIWVNTLNPKTALFFVAVFPQFVDPTAEQRLESRVLGSSATRRPSTRLSSRCSWPSSSCRSQPCSTPGGFLVRRR